MGSEWAVRGGQYNGQSAVLWRPGGAPKGVLYLGLHRRHPGGGEGVEGTPWRPNLIPRPPTPMAWLSSRAEQQFT